MTTDLAVPTDRTPTGLTLQTQIREMESQFALAMPKGLEAAQLVRDALTCLRQTPNLANALSLIHISEPTRPRFGSRMPSSA